MQKAALDGKSFRCHIGNRCRSICFQWDIYDQE